jgi:CheY-like chemotaxis protein
MNTSIKPITSSPKMLTPSPSQAPLPADTLHPKSILIADDNTVIRAALSTHLKTRGYAVNTAVDGGSVVSFARTQKPDLILLDMTFPPDVAHGGGVAWDGFLIMNWLRRMDTTAKIPVIIMTGDDPAKIKDRCLAAGAVAFFHKPFDNDALLATIQRTLGEVVTGPPMTTTTS